MTTIGKISAECVICGKESEHTSITSSNAMGSPDLDLRPPEMQRSTMEWWLQECPACGYVAPDISESVASIKAIVEIFEQSKTGNIGSGAPPGGVPLQRFLPFDRAAFRAQWAK